MRRACIFDLDGVIVDTARYHFLAWSRLAKELNLPFSEQDNERLKGVGRMESLDILLSLGGGSPPDQAEREKLASRKNAWFVQYIDGMGPDEIFPGVKQLIAALREREIRIGLASSSKNAPQVVRTLGIADVFDVIVDGSMIKHAKPHPEIFLLTSTRLEVPAVDCVVFEDAAAGIEAALSAGMKCVGIGSKEHLGRANMVVARTGDFDPASFDEL